MSYYIHYTAKCQSISRYHKYEKKKEILENFMVKTVSVLKTESMMSNKPAYIQFSTLVEIGRYVYLLKLIVRYRDVWCNLRMSYYVGKSRPLSYILLRIHTDQLESDVCSAICTNNCSSLCNICAN